MTFRKSNKMPADFKNRVSQGMKLHHRRKRIDKAKRALIEVAMDQWGNPEFRAMFTPVLRDACEALNNARSSK